VAAVSGGSQFVGLAFVPSKADLKDCVLHASQTQSSDLKIHPCEIS